MPKVVYNRSHGGFSLSAAAAARYAELKGGDVSRRDIPRHDPVLVQVVEEMGADANGLCAELAIKEIPEGSAYRIEEYEGKEVVYPRHDVEWMMPPNLIAALESADIGNRGLDAQIWCWRERIEYREDDDAFWKSVIDSAAPHYTTSLDASFALFGHLLPGWGYELTRYPDQLQIGASVFRENPYRSFSARRHGLPLALTIAVLKAYAETQGDG